MYGQDSEPVTLARDVKAIIVPAGDQVILRKGARALLTQALGGSFTIYLDGNLFRIAGEDADALGKEPVLPPQLPEDAADEDVEQLVWEQLRTCYDPEIPINIVDLGLIYKFSLKSAGEGLRDVKVTMTLTAPGCGMGEVLVMDVKDKLEIIPTIREARVELTFDPPWSRDMMSEAARLQTGMY
jgi:probable FeS assembly SUF system protein SufT